MSGDWSSDVCSSDLFRILIGYSDRKRRIYSSGKKENEFITTNRIAIWNRFIP